MSLLAEIHTELGTIRLHKRKDGRYETRRYYTDVLTGERRDCRILVSMEQAREWVEQACRRGHVYSGPKVRVEL